METEPETSSFFMLEAALEKEKHVIQEKVSIRKTLEALKDTISEENLEQYFSEGEIVRIHSL